MVTPLAIYHIRKRIKFIIDIKCITEVFKYSSPMLMSVVIVWVLNFSDRFFVANLTNYENAGIYSLAAKFVSIISLFAGAIFQAYTPLIYNIAITMTENEAKQKLKEANSIISFLICMMGVGVLLISNVILEIFFSNEYSGALIYIYLLSISAVIMQQTGMLNIMIYQNKKTFSLSIIIIASGILSVVLNASLIPLLGSITAAISNFVVGLFLISNTIILARKNYYIPINYKLLLYWLLFMSCCFVIDFTQISYIQSFIIKLLLFAIWFYIGLELSLVNLVKVKELFRNILKK